MLNVVTPELPRRCALAALAALGTWPVWASSNRRKIKVIALYTVPFEQQWVSRVHTALTTAQKDDGIEYQALENIRPSEYANVLREQAKTAPDVIFGESFEVEEAARKVATEFPGVAFVMGSSGKPQAPNFSVFDNFIHEPAYLAGMIAGGISKSGRIGLLGGYAIPEVNRLMNAFMDGAREINPKAQFMTGEIRSWLNPHRASRMTSEMIAAGVDAIFAATMAGVVETAAAAKNVYVFGNIIHPQKDYPKTVVASALWKVEPTVQAVLRDVQQGKPFANDYSEWSFMHKGGSDLSPYGTFENELPKDLVNRVEQRKKAILANQFVVKIKDDIKLTMK